MTLQSFLRALGAPVQDAEEGGRTDRPSRARTPTHITHICAVFCISCHAGCLGSKLTPRRRRSRDIRAVCTGPALTEPRLHRPKGRDRRAHHRRTRPDSPPVPLHPLIQPCRRHNRSRCVSPTTRAPILTVVPSPPFPSLGSPNTTRPKRTKNTNKSHTTTPTTHTL